MIELPEAVTISAQMEKELRGRVIAGAVRGNAPHKFAFYNHEPEEYAAILKGKTVAGSAADANLILTDLDPGYTLYLGGGGERILLHTGERTLPAKHQFLLRFEDGCFLTVTIQMWGSILLVPRGEKPPIYPHSDIPSPLTADFTLDLFLRLFDEIPPEDTRSVKFFLISKPGIPGLGNGYTQDVLFNARLHPRHRVRDLNPDQKESLFHATRDTLTRAGGLGGRDTELDLYGCPGRYTPILSAKTAGKPCPVCGAAVLKESFLGGAIYFCPRCQE